MKILVGCEESQAVTIELRELGHEAYSCDLKECSGGHPEWHIKDDILNVLKDGWDKVFCHIPCTYKANSGARWLWNKDGTKNIDRWINLEKEVKLWHEVNNLIKVGYIENSLPHKYARDGFQSVLSGKWIDGIGKYSQIVHPYMHGHPERKSTCLWIKGLQNIKDTKNVYHEMIRLSKKDQNRIHYLPPSKERAALRAKTFPGIAKAIASQLA